MPSPYTSTSFALTLPSLTQSVTGIVHDIGQIAQLLPTVTQTGTALGTQGVFTATGAIVLPSLTQTGTASYPLQELLISSVPASSNPFEYATETLISEVITEAPLSAVVAQLLTSTVSTTDTLTYDEITFLESTVQASESFLDSSEITLISSSVLALDEIVPSYSKLLTSTVNTQTSFEFGRDLSIESTVSAAGNIVSPGVVYNQNVESTINASDFYQLGISEALADTVNASELITTWAIVEKSLSSVVNITTTPTINSWLYYTLDNTAQVSESITFEGSIYGELLISTSNVSDWMWSKDFGAIAWVLNTQSAGITNYDNFGFTSLAFHAGKLYATSPEGLFELDADDDDGRNIDALYKGGFLDFGSESKKRISDIFIGYTGGELECDVETFDKAVYTYPMEYREADAPHNSRIKTGRGLASRYWRFGFRNIGGADFQIQDIAVQAAVSKRRL